MTKMDFEDIRPYNNFEFKEAYLRLLEYRGFQEAMAMFLPDYPICQFRKDLENFNTVDEVQCHLDKRFVDVFIAQSSKGVILSGIENVNDNETYMYIGNHRDITFDPALLEYYFFVEKRKTSRIAVGDNLYSTPVLNEVAKLNKMVKVKRTGTMRERLENSYTLATYIQQSLFEENESVWIAQRDGRTKDGNDYTKHGLVKMITLGNDKNLMETIRRMRITPVTVSYEFEPCDKLKARELAISEHTVYQKQPGEDFNEMELSALREVGNIITGAYLNSLSTLTNMMIYPSVPFLAVDMAAAILSVPAIQFGMVGDKILLIQSQFSDDIDIDGFFVLMPDLESYDKILSSLGIST